MSAGEVLLWLRGPGFVLACVVLVFGGALRLVEIFGLGRRGDLAVPRTPSPGSGLRTVFSRSLPPRGMVRRSPVTYLGGYVFHCGLLLTVFFYRPHIEVFKGIFGLSWPGLPTPLIDLVAVFSLAALSALLAHRLADPVKRLISGPSDYLAWTLTVLPLLTGYLAYHHLFFDYRWLLIAHIAAVELLLVVLPFSKLFHTVAVFSARYYTGQIAGRKGVAL